MATPPQMLVNTIEAVAGNGHVASIPPPRLRMDRADWLLSAGNALTGSLLLCIAVLLPRLWATQRSVLADAAVGFTAAAWCVLGTIFLPLWARHWRIGIISALYAGVVVMIAGVIEGSAPLPALWAAVKVSLYFGAISTLWEFVSRYVAWARMCWLVLVLWTLGFPLLVYLRLDSMAQMESHSTFLHFHPASLVR